MCGICGFLSDKAIDDNIIKRMTDSMYHRGPDFQDTCYLEQRLNQYGAFGHCRLSILDLSEKAISLCGQRMVDIALYIMGRYIII